MDLSSSHGTGQWTLANQAETGRPQGLAAQSGEFRAAKKQSVFEILPIVIKSHFLTWQARRESNPQPAVLETAALPIELLA